MLAIAHTGEAQTTRAPEQATGAVFFPDGEIYRPLIADPREARSFVSVLRGTFQSLDKPNRDTTSIASLGLGDGLALVRWGGPAAGDGVQLDVVGSISAQFYIGSGANDLINADYLIGVPITARRKGFSVRARLYHQSSHLGDEYLARHDDVEIENLSFESVELLVSQEIGAVRGYAGGERVVHRRSASVPLTVFHGGIEARTRRANAVQLVAGIDLKTTELHDWSPAISGRVGLELARPSPAGHPGRVIALLVELYEGASSYGQFFQEDVSYVGIGLHFGL